MKLADILQIASTGMRIRRKKNEHQIFVIVSGKFYYDGGIVPEDSRSPYHLTVTDILADDWEYQSTKWESE